MLVYYGRTDTKRKDVLSLTQTFLSPAEIDFYHILRQAVGDKVIICPKVSLGDLFFPKLKGMSKPPIRLGATKLTTNTLNSYFVNPKSMQPLLGIQLDDASHHERFHYNAAGKVLHLF